MKNCEMIDMIKNEVINSFNAEMEFGSMKEKEEEYKNDMDAMISFLNNLKENADEKLN